MQHSLPKMRRDLGLEPAGVSTPAQTPPHLRRHFHTSADTWETLREQARPLRPPRTTSAPPTLSAPRRTARWSCR